VYSGAGRGGAGRGGVHSHLLRSLISLAQRLGVAAGLGNSSESRKLTRASSSCLSRASLISFSCRRDVARVSSED
jgi:hypothetical protein